MAGMQHNVLWQQAQRAAAAGRFDEARGCCEQILSAGGENADVRLTLGRIDLAQSRYASAAAHLQRAVTQRPGDAAAQLTLAEVLTFQGRFDDALARCDTVLRRDPDDPRAIARKAEALEKSGRRDEARALLGPLIEQGTETVQQAIVQARLDTDAKDYDAAINLTTRHIARQETLGRPFPNLYFLLGRALERSGRYDEAFEAYTRGNTAVLAPFDPASWAQVVESIIEAYTPQRFAAVPRAAHGSTRPVFVVGMPRCGSTLVETILDAHPDAVGAGELQDMDEIIGSIALDIGSSLPYPACIEDLDQADVDATAQKYLDRIAAIDPTAARVVDKHLGNFVNVGLLAILFPEARIIHCRRDPLDTCFSCFAAPLSPAAHPYTADLARLGAVYRQYERVMRHWRQALAIPMLELDYEALVSDQDKFTRRIVEYCGLPWDDRCLRYYETGRVALTASYDQVDKPIYSSAVGRHRHFDAHLGPLRDALAGGG
jgi:tetratricopeptide (TPR) repeat protein